MAASLIFPVFAIVSADVTDYLVFRWKYGPVSVHTGSVLFPKPIAADFLEFWRLRAQQTRFTEISLNPKEIDTYRQLSDGFGTYDGKGGVGYLMKALNVLVASVSGFIAMLVGLGRKMEQERLRAMHLSP